MAPLRDYLFTGLNRSNTLYLPKLEQPEAEAQFDWGFDFDVPWERLSIFTRHMDTAAPVTRMPVFAFAEFRLTAASSAALQHEAEKRIVFPKYPLGVVATDHVGYGSFDLWPLRNIEVLQSLKNTLSNAGLMAKDAPRLTIELSRLLALPYKDPSIAFDALTEGDLGPNFIVLRMDMDIVMLANREVWPPMPAMQTPGIDDWRLSPGSFSMAGALLIGEDGCETLLPANLATRMVRFQQLVRTRTEAEAMNGREGLDNRFKVFELPGFSGKVRLGYSVNYQSEWFPVGHSLGQISYSLPLAPGEKMKIAIIDWSRHDAAKRSEDTTEKEDLQHAALRDRTLTEAVQMVVRESQSGSSFMAGGALSAGAGIPIGPVSLGVGGAFGTGGASTDSEGMRSIVGDTTQKINDAFHQASSAQRELNSTVVVQADQAETGEARTRTVANYNHSHALTILYYEVLQHHRVLTKPASIHPVLFLKHEATNFDLTLGDEPNYGLIERYMNVIAANLLDESVRGCLEVVKKRACLKLNFDREKARRDAQGVPSDDYELGEFTFWVLTGNVAPEENITLKVIPKAGGTPIDCAFTDLSLVAQAPIYDNSEGHLVGHTPVPTILNNSANPRPVRANEEFLATLRPRQKIRWGNIAAFEVGLTYSPANNPPTYHNRPTPADWNIQKMRFSTQEGADKWTMFDAVPTPANVKNNGSTRANVKPFKPPLTSVDDMLSDEERCCLQRLVDHLNAHAGYYWRAIWMGESASDRAVRLDGWKIGNELLLDLIDNNLYDVDGEYLVLPVAAGAQDILDRQFHTHKLGLSRTAYLEYVEQLLTVPARGVFAEAKLGHCNASELIDPSRFWDWQTSPIPDQAPEIDPVSLASRYQDLIKALAATPFPNPIVNIVNPQALPDPSGFNTASGVLAALGPFRDMSGIKELGPYLQTLSNNATQLAAQGMKNAQTSSLMNQIRSAKELPPEKRADLMSELLTGQVKNTVTPEPKPDQPPEPKPDQPKPDQPPEPKPDQPKPQPKPQKPVVLSPKTRRLEYHFKYDTETEMWGYYQVTLWDQQTGKPYIPDGDIPYGYMQYVDIPSSLKENILIHVEGQVKPNRIVTPAGTEAKMWEAEIQKTELFASIEGVTGFNIIGQTKPEHRTLTLETAHEHTDTHTTGDKWGASLKGGGNIEVVELEGGYTYEWTTTKDVTDMDGDKKIRTITWDVLMLDKQKQPKIEAVKKG